MLLFLSLLVASASVSQDRSADSLTRPCKAITAEQPGTRKSSGGKKKGDSKRSFPGVANCMETRLAPLDVQEYLQKFVREQQWSAKDQQAGEDMWAFTISLDKESLAKYTKPFVDPHIQWRGGRGLVRVRTKQQNDGYTQVFITATFDGYGDSEDMLATRRDRWPMESNGNLESELIHAVERHTLTSH